MRKHQLTDMKIKNLPSKQRQYEVYDGTIPGLCIRVSPGGNKSYTLLYRIHGRQRRYTLGRYPLLSLKAAREKAMDALRLVSAGKDPQAIATTERIAVHSPLFPFVVAEFIEKHAKRKTRTWRETQKTLERSFVPRWQAIAISSITRRHVHQALDEMVINNGPSAANHGFAHIRKFFNWCVERGELAHNPCMGMKPPTNVSSRDRVLTEDELRRIWRALEEMGYPFGPYVQLLLLTGQRRIEVANLEWSHVDLEARLWTQPAASNKTKRVHLVPLSGTAIDLITRLPKHHPVLMFPARGNTNNGISGFSKWKKSLDALSGAHNWTLHDLRRTMATFLAAANTSHLVVDLLLNHSSVALSTVGAVYNRHDYLLEKRQAIDKWACIIGHIIQSQHIERKEQ